MTVKRAQKRLSNCNSYWDDNESQGGSNPAVNAFSILANCVTKCSDKPCTKRGNGRGKEPATACRFWLFLDLLTKAS